MTLILKLTTLSKEECVFMKYMLVLETIAANPQVLILLAGVGLCAYVFSGSKRGNFSIGFDGISINFEK